MPSSHWGCFVTRSTLNRCTCHSTIQNSASTTDICVIRLWNIIIMHILSSVKNSGAKFSLPTQDECFRTTALGSIDRRNDYGRNNCDFINLPIGPFPSESWLKYSYFFNLGGFVSYVSLYRYKRNFAHFMTLKSFIVTRDCNVTTLSSRYKIINGA